MKFILGRNLYRKIDILIGLIFTLVTGLILFGFSGITYGDTYEKVWDSGNMISGGTRDVATGDTDCDGLPEIIVSNYPSSGGARIYVFEKTGDNSYQPIWDSGTLLTMRKCFIAIGDQDKDGKKEIIAAESRIESPYSGKLHIFENNGDNSYQEVWHSGTAFNGIEFTALFLGDADNDGNCEIIIGTGLQCGDKKIRVYENTGDNAYVEVWNSGGYLSDTVDDGAIGDTDGDGKKEIIVGSGHQQRYVYIFENNGDNSYELIQSIGGFGKSPQAFIGDQDSDGKSEIIVGSGDLVVRVYEHNGVTGENTYINVWNSGTLHSSGGSLPLVATGDQDRDGKKEIVVSGGHSHKVYLFENTGDNAYVEVWNSGSIINGYIYRVTTGDQDADGAFEIIAISHDESKVYVFEGNGPPSANAGDNIQIPSADQAYTVINGMATDPNEDVLEYRWAEGSNSLLVWSSVGSNGEADLDLGTLPYFSIGNHTLTLEIREVGEGGLSDSDNMVLTIQNSPPEAQPAPTSQTVEIGVDPIIVVADVADFDGDTLSYEWCKDDEVLESGTTETVQGGDAVQIPDLNVSAGDPRFPLGIHEIELRVSDGTNDAVSASVSVEVIDTTAPSLSPIPSVTILWPPNHELQPVTIQANAYDNGGGTISLNVTVESSEPPDTNGDGNTIPDYYIDSVDDGTGQIELRLRSERSGKGDGRIYTIVITATDETGNSSDATVELLAPHDRRKK